MYGSNSSRVQWAHTYARDGNAAVMPWRGTPGGSCNHSSGEDPATQLHAPKQLLGTKFDHRLLPRNFWNRRQLRTMLVGKGKGNGRT